MAHGSRSGTAVAVACLLAVGTVSSVGEARSGLAQRGQGAADAAALTVLQLRPNFYMIAGAGANIGVQVGDDGVVVVDAGSAPNTDAVIAAIKKISPRPIRYVIDTSADGDHVGGNAAVAKAGQTLF